MSAEFLLKMVMILTIAKMDYTQMNDLSRLLILKLEIFGPINITHNSK